MFFEPVSLKLPLMFRFVLHALFHFKGAILVSTISFIVKLEQDIVHAWLHFNA